MYKKFIKIFLSFALLAVSEFSAAKDYKHLVDIPGGVTASEMVSVAKMAAQGRRWQLVEQSDDSIKVHIDHRGVVSDLELKVIGKELSYWCEGTRTMKKKKGINPNTGVQKTYVSTESFVPEKWIKNIQIDIDKQLSGLSHRTKEH